MSILFTVCIIIDMIIFLGGGALAIWAIWDTFR